MYLSIYILQNILKPKALLSSNIQKGILVYEYTKVIYWCLKVRQAKGFKA